MDIDKYFTSNDAVGDAFLAGIYDTQIKWEISRKLFTQFMLENHFDAWHIHDGWVQHNGRSGDVLLKDELELTWIDEHGGFSHSGMCPNVGGKIMILKDSAGTHHPNELTSFKVYCYEVISKKEIFYNRMELKFIEVKECVFNEQENKYEFYVHKFKEDKTTKIIKFMKRLLFLLS